MQIHHHDTMDYDSLKHSDLSSMSTLSQSSQGHPSNLNPPEAHEVQSVRKQVEGMGVENQPDEQELPRPSSLTPDKTVTATAEPARSITSPQQKDTILIDPDPNNLPKPTSFTSDSPNITPDPLPPLNSTSNQLPSSWDAYADLHSPFACFAPRPNPPIFAQPAVAPSSSTGSSGDPPLARAFAPSPAFGNHNGSNSLCPKKFPSGSDFFLKGKRNTPLADSSPEADPESATQNKKLKLPPSSSSPSVPVSSTSSSSNNTQHGLANYALGSSTSLKSQALDKLNKNPSLQISSLQPQSVVSSFLTSNQPSSLASSVCAVNGEADDLAAPISTQVSNSFGFSAFANTSGFHDSSKSTDHPPSSSVFDQTPRQPFHSPDQNGSNAENPEWDAAKSTQKKTHLALSAELSQEDKHEGFLATELMRADAVLRVLLNVPIFKGFSYRPTQEKFLTFASTVVSNIIDEDKSVNGCDAGRKEEVDASAGVQAENNQKTHFQQYLCRFGKPEARQEMTDGIQDCLKQLENPQYPEIDQQDLERGTYLGDEEGPCDAADLV